MKRFGALLVALALATTCTADARKPHRTPKVAVLVDTGRPGATIPKSFLGFSIEYPDLPAYAGPPGAPNDLFARLLQTLSAYGNGAPSLRIGGHSTDQAWWNPNRTPRPPDVFTDLTPDWIASLAGLVYRTGVPVTLGVNLGLNDPENGRALALAVRQALAGGTPESLEIGNEPDLFARPTTFYVGPRVQRRAQHRATYTFQQYADEVQRYVDALSPDGYPMSVGGFATSGWDPFSSPLLDRLKGRISGFSAHSYPLATCGAARKRPKRQLIGELLASRRAPTRIRKLAVIARAHGVGLRVSELNSAVCGGVSGVSNSFASALWSVNALFAYFQAGASGVNLHTWDGAFYSPVEFRTAGGRRLAVVHPLYYGMLFFARATAQRAQLLPTISRPRRHVIRVWATRNIGGTVRLVIINTSQDRRMEARVAIPGLIAGGSLERLRAPALDAPDGATLAGKSYGRASFDGLLRGRHLSEIVSLRRNRYAFVLPAASATLLTVRP